VPTRISDHHSDPLAHLNHQRAGVDVRTVVQIGVDVFEIPHDIFGHCMNDRLPEEISQQIYTRTRTSQRDSLLIGSRTSC